MRKTLMAGLIASTFAFAGGASAAPLVFDLNGSANSGGEIVATALDWTQTSFLAKGGNQAISNYLANLTDGGTRSTTFDVYTHAKLVAYTNVSGVSLAVPNAGGEITVTAKFTESVTSANLGAGFASFSTTGAGWVEMYYSATANSDNLTGSGFNDGTLIMRGTGVTGALGSASALGAFFNTGYTGAALDSFNADDYTGQTTVNGFGSQASIKFGSGGFAVDSNYLKTAITDFSILFQNISIGLPYTTVDPSDCFNTTANGASDGAITGHTATGNASTCNTHHDKDTYANQTLTTGYLPVVGNVNGAFGGSPDFLAQTDFNSAVSGTVPEPSALALVGLALAGLGISARRRRA